MNKTLYSTSSSAQATSPFPPSTPNWQSTHTTRTTQLVPAMQLKMGFGYEYFYGKRAMLSVEAGFDTEVYINAIQTVNMGSQVTELGTFSDSVGYFARTFYRELSNFALAGPYGTVNIAF
jgi:hypothetical protein